MILYKGELHEQKTELDLRAFTPGTYILELRSTAGTHPERKIVVIK